MNDDQKFGPSKEELAFCAGLYWAKHGLLAEQACRLRDYKEVDLLFKGQPTAPYSWLDVLFAIAHDIDLDDESAEDSIAIHRDLLLEEFRLIQRDHGVPFFDAIQAADAEYFEAFYFGSIAVALPA